MPRKYPPPFNLDMDPEAFRDACISAGYYNDEYDVQRLAKETDSSRVTIYRWKREISRPEPYRLRRIVKALNVHYADLLIEPVEGVETWIEARAAAEEKARKEGKGQKGRRRAKPKSRRKRPQA